MNELRAQVLTHYEIDLAAITPVSNRLNTLYRLADASGQAYTLRVGTSSGRTPRMAEGEMRWLEALHRDQVVVAPRPIPNRAGELVTYPKEGDLLALYTWFDGEEAEPAINIELAEWMGRTLARLHGHTHNQDWTAYDLPIVDRLWYRADAVDLMAHCTWFQPGARTVLRSTIRHVEPWIAKLYQQAAPPQLLYFDMHPRNIIRQEDGTYALIDFDDCALGYPIQDVGNTLFCLLDQPNAVDLRQAFLEAYQHEAGVPPFERADLRAALSHRILVVLNFWLGRQGIEARDKARLAVTRLGQLMTGRMPSH